MLAGDSAKLGRGLETKRTWNEAVRGASHESPHLREQGGVLAKFAEQVFELFCADYQRVVLGNQQRGIVWRLPNSLYLFWCVLKGYFCTGSLWYDHGWGYQGGDRQFKRVIFLTFTLILNISKILKKFWILILMVACGLRCLSLS